VQTEEETREKEEGEAEGGTQEEAEGGNSGGQEAADKMVKKPAAEQVAAQKLEDKRGHELESRRKEADRLEATRKREVSVEAERPEADRTGDEGGDDCHSRSCSDKQNVRERNLQERLGEKIPPAAGETSPEVTDASRLNLLAGYIIPCAVSPIAKSYADSLPITLEKCIVRLPTTYQERMLMEILADSGMLLSGFVAETFSGKDFRFHEKRS
jgi:hypothetical protein